MKVQIALIAAAVVAAAALTAGNTLAFFTDRGEVNNVVTTGDVNITLTEPLFSQNSNYTVSGVTPGQKIIKDPKITNVGGHDAYIRCKIAVGGLPEKFSRSQELTPTQELLSGLDIDSGNWVLGNSGYYYYQQALPKKTATESPSVYLFRNVSIPKTWDSSIADKTFTISIYAEAIQTDHFSPARDSQNRIIGWNYSDGTEVTA